MQSPVHQDKLTAIHTIHAKSISAMRLFNSVSFVFLKLSSQEVVEYFDEISK